MPRLHDIAIVGMAARFAQAPDVGTFWENVLGKVDAISDASDRWAKPFFDPQSEDSARIYTRRGGFLGDVVNVYPAECGVMPAAVAGGDADHFLALDAAMAALADAGYAARSFDRTRTGVILGHGTYVNRGYNTLLHHGQVIDETLAYLQALQPDLGSERLALVRRALQKVLPPFSATTVPSLVPNVITGRIANRLDLCGPNYIVDAACASSLVAIELAIAELVSGRCSMMLTGGVHASTPPQIYMMFCLLQALSRSDVRPFDASAAGTLLGEGLGLLVLKRRADAERDGDRVYALIQGSGTSSDGKAVGLLTPRKEGQVLALSRAYAESGIDPATIELVEAHGTGTPVGDRTEIESLREVFGSAGATATRALGSVKSMIGHCISAAGAAGVIKTALALHEQVLPPMLCDRVNPDLPLAEGSFYINVETRPWIADPSRGPRRAAVNAFGFGGVNAHLVLEEYRGAAAHRRSGVRRAWPTELLLVSGSGRHELASRLRALASTVTDQPRVPLASVARRLSALPPGPTRLAMVCGDVPQLHGAIASVLEALDHDDAAPPRVRDVYYADARETPSGPIAFLFPGEGSQHPNMLADLAVTLPGVRRWFDLLDEVFADAGGQPPSRAIFPPPTCVAADEAELLRQRLYGFDLGSASVFVASMAVQEVLSACGVRPAALVGHSTGEGAALVAAGVITHSDRGDLVRSMRRFYGTCRELDRSGKVPRGRMISVGAIDDVALGQVLHAMAGRAVVALDNCRNQKVLFCADEDAAELTTRLQQAGGLCAVMDLDRGYHTAHFAKLAATLRGLYDEMDVREDGLPVWSCATAEPFPRMSDAVRALATRQWFSPVRFRETVQRMHAHGIRTFVEVGPGTTLIPFVRDVLAGSDYIGLSSAPQGKPALAQLQRLLGQLFVRGVDVDLAPLFASRAVDADVVEQALPRSAPAPIDLTMPRMQPTPEILDLLGSSAPAAPDATAADAPAADTPRLAVLQAHFRLMKDFLAAQARVMGTAAAVPPAAPATWPLLGTILERSPTALRTERRFDTERDPWLRDHTLGGAFTHEGTRLDALPVVPLTMFMEIVAEAATCLHPGRELVALQNIRAHRWLALDTAHATVSIAAALRQDSAGATRVDVSVRQVLAGETEEGRLVAEGTAVLDVRAARPPAPAVPVLRNPDASHYRRDMLYGPLRANERFAPMFHGPRFAVVDEIRGWNAEAIEGVIVVNNKSAFFRDTIAPDLQLDPVLLDAAGQLIGYWVAERFGADLTFFPFSVHRYRQYTAPPAAGQRVICRAVIRLAREGTKGSPPRFEFVGHAGDVLASAGEGEAMDRALPQVFDHCRLVPADAFLEARFDFLDDRGSLIAQIEGWRDRYFSIPHRHYRFHLRPSTEFFSVSRPAGAALVCRRIDPALLPYLEEGWQIWKRALAHLVLTARERDEWNRMTHEDPVATSWLLARIAAKDAVREWLQRRHDRTLAAVQIDIADASGATTASAPDVAGLPLPDVRLAEAGGVHIAVAFDATESADRALDDPARTADLGSVMTLSSGAV